MTNFQELIFLSGDFPTRMFMRTPHDHLTTDRQSLQLVMENVNRVTVEGGQVFDSALMKEAAKQVPVTRA